MVDTAATHAAGLAGGAADAATTLFARAESVLRATAAAETGAQREPCAAFWVPGRIEFLGKHTDYAGGRSLVCAVDRGIAVVARRHAGTVVRVHDARLGETVAAALSPDAPLDAAGWSAYPAAVARRLARNFRSVTKGVEIAFASNLPPAAGMSSSSALIIGAYLAIAWANELASQPEYLRELSTAERLAEYLGSVESGRDFGSLAGDRGIGTMSGSQDQTAILCGRSGALVQYAFCPVRPEGAVELPRGHVFAVASSGVRAEKGAGAQARYNAVALRAAAAAAAWRRGTGYADRTLGDIAARGPDAVARLRDLLASATGMEFSAAELLARVDQFIAESTDIIPATAGALARGELTRVGELVARSQANADRWLGNQIPETRWLVEAMQRNAVAASAFGAGFGGSVWALVPEDDAGELMARWRAGYLERFPEHADAADFFLTAAGPPATQLV